MSREATFFSGDVMQQHWADDPGAKTSDEPILRSVRRWQTSKKTCK
jgi:hypothetical protein